MRSDRQTNELVLTALHPGVSVDHVRQETGWELRVAETLTVNAAPSAEELRALRDLHDRTRRAHGGEDSGDD
jgi:glutaconate CoA-transferase subunit B